MSEQQEKAKLAVLWTRGEREMAETMVYMYIRNAKLNGWWRDILLIVWGPSAKLLAGDANLQEKTRQLLDIGVQVEACVACTDLYGVSERLRGLGVTVRGMGAPLTEMLKDEGWTVLAL